LKGEEVTLQLRQENFVQMPEDVYAVIWSAAGGFGDPLERDPLKVREDVLDQRSVSLPPPRTIYGVVIDRDHLDPVATKKLRAEIARGEPQGGRGEGLGQGRGAHHR